MSTNDANHFSCEGFLSPISVKLRSCGLHTRSCPSRTGWLREAKTVKKIGVIHQLASWEMYVIMQDAIEEIAKKEGVEIVSADGDGDAGKQIQAIETMMNAGVDGYHLCDH